MFEILDQTPHSAIGDLALARSLVKAADLVGEPQEQARADVLAFIDSHPDALYRTCLDGHLTGSAAVVDQAGQQVLLIHHLKLRRWLQPGGHADGDGHLGAVAIREAEEETGLADLQLVEPAIDIDIHLIPARKTDPEHLHLDLRFLVLAQGELEPKPDMSETMGAEWVTPLTAEALDGDVRRLIARALDVSAGLSKRTP